MTTRNLVPRVTGEGKIGISTKKWAEVNATSASFTTLKVTNLKLDSEADLSLFTKGAGIEDISTNVNGQFVIAMDDSFLTDLGFDANGAKPDFTSTGTIAAGDSIIAAMNKLDTAISNVASPTSLSLSGENSGNFDPNFIDLAGEFTDADDHLMTSAAIDDHIRSFGFGDITEVTAGSGLSGGGASGAITLSIADQNDANNGGFDAGQFGSASAIPQITVNQKGIITAITTQNVATTLTLSGDNNPVPEISVSLLSDTLNFSGSTGITTNASDNEISISLDDTLVTPGSYGSATAIPTFTVDAQGRLTAAGTAEISTTLNILSDDGGPANPVELADDTLSLLGGTGITSTNTGDAVTFNLDNTDVTPGGYGSATQVATFSVDAQGRLTAAEDVAISITSSQVSDADSANIASVIVKRDGSGDFSAGTITAALVGNASTASAWQDARTITLGGDLTGNVSIDGSQDVTLNATIAADSVALGTDTTGNYVQSLTAGTGIATLPAASETADLTISVDGVLAQLDNLDPLADGDDDGKFIVATAANTFAYESGATVRSSLGLGDLSPLAGNAGLSMSNNLLIDNAKELRLGELDINGAEYIAIKSPNSIANSYTLTLPDSQGADGTVLVTDADGNLTWETVEAAAGNAVNAFSIISVDANGQANLVADTSQDTLNISEGTGISLATDADTDTLTISVNSSEINTLSALASAGSENNTLSALGSLSVAQNLTVSGNLIVNGSSTTIDTQTLTVEDPLIKLAMNNNASDAVDIGFYGLYDKSGNNSQDSYAGLFRDASDEKFKLFKDLQVEPTTTVNLAGAGYASATLVADLEGDVTGTVSSLANHTTTDLTEGANLYFTDARAQDALTVTDAGGDGSLTYADGTITYTGPSAAETRAHFSGGTGVTITNGEIAIGQTVAVTDDVTFNSVSANLTGNVTGTVSSLANHDTADLAEGANLYYTDARSRAAVSVTDAGGDGSLTYNNGTGVITYTGPSAAETRAHFSAGTGVTITNGAIAIEQSVATTADVTFNSVTANLTGNVTGTVSNVSNHDTDDIAEGVGNLYHTTARARGSISVTDSGGDGSLGYNNTTGVITYTGPSAAETRAHFSAGTGVTITNGSIAIGQEVAKTDNVQFAGFKFADGDTFVTGIDTEIGGDATNALFPTALAVKNYVDNEITNHCLLVIGNDYDSEDAGTILNVDLSGDEKLEIIGSEGITTSVSSGADNTKDTVTVSISQNGIGLDRIEKLTSMTVVGNVAEALASPAEVSIKDEDDMATNSASALVTQRSVKAFVEAKLGRHGGMFKTSQRVDGNGDPIQEGGNNIYDVVFSAAPIIRSHFGPFAFSLNDLHTLGGSDIIFYGSDSYQSSDRHFEVLVRKDGNGDIVEEGGAAVYDTIFTGADSTTP